MPLAPPLTERPTPTKPENWTLDLPPQVQAALLVADARANVDLTGTGPVFPDVFVPLLGSDTNMGAITGTAVREVEQYLKRHGVAVADRSTIANAMRHDAYGSGPFHAGLGNLLRWFEVEDIYDAEQDDDEDGDL